MRPWPRSPRFAASAGRGPASAGSTAAWMSGEARRPGPPPGWRCLLRSSSSAVRSLADALLGPRQPLAQRGVRLARRLRREPLQPAAQAVEARRHLVAAGDIVGEALFQRRHPVRRERRDGIAVGCGRQADRPSSRAAARQAAPRPGLPPRNRRQCRRGGDALSARISGGESPARSSAGGGSRTSDASASMIGGASRSASGGSA